ncbi:MAG: hypothetical protein ABJ382_15375, partial [Ilumatobacter sp.]
CPSLEPPQATPARAAAHAKAEMRNDRDGTMGVNVLVTGSEIAPSGERFGPVQGFPERGRVSAESGVVAWRRMENVVTA